MENNSSWIWGIIYYNSADERLFVPKKIGIGITLNFAHPRALTFAPFFLIFISMLVILLVMIHSGSLDASSLNAELILIFPAVSALLLLVPALISKFARGAGIDIALAGWGGMIFIVAMSLQRLLVIPYLNFRGGLSAATAAADIIILSLFAALAQEMVRYMISDKIIRQKPFEETPRASAALSLGLGFAAVEIMVLSLKNIMVCSAAASGDTNVWLGVMERFSASLVHVSFSVFIICGIFTGRLRFWLGLSIALHWLVDFFAGAFSSGLIKIDPYHFEFALLAFSAVLFASALGRMDPLADGGQKTSPDEESL